jgi:hypothetical protein
MARSYRTDQWLGLDNKASGESDPRSGLPGLAGSAVAGARNHDFIYPDRLVRTINKYGNPKVTPLRRGYIRGVNYANVTRSNLKCQFQFNPALINQSVAQNTQTLNFTQQQPEQFAQPMYGNVNFNFELFFDRSAELNNPFNATGALRADRPNPADPRFAETNPWQSKSPAEVGVLHDVGVFFGVIGVGIDEAMVSYLEKQSIAAYNENIDGDSEVTEALNLAELSANIDNFVRWNAGNSAFLVPLPVRVVFSSLYVVEGFVSNVTLQLSKFNSSMVPMQCTLKVEMEAKYIGFAKKDTILTHSLSALQEVEPEDPTTPTLTQTQSEALQDLRTLQVYLDSGDNATVSSSTTRDSQTRKDLLDNTSHTNNVNMSQFVSRKAGISNRRLSGRPETGDNKLDFYIHGFFDSEATNRHIYRLMADTGANITVSSSGFVTGYRYTLNFRNNNAEVFTRADNTVNGNSESISEYRAYQEVERVLREEVPNSEARWELENNHNGDDHEFESVAKLFTISIGSSNIQEERFEGISVASSVSNWDKMARYAFKSNKQHGGTPGGVDDDLANPADFPGDLMSSDRFPDTESFYYFLKFQFTINVDFGDGNKVSRTATNYIYNRSIGTNFRTVKTLEFQWPLFSDIELGNPNVDTSNIEGIIAAGVDVDFSGLTDAGRNLLSANPDATTNPNLGRNPAQQAATGGLI